MKLEEITVDNWGHNEKFPRGRTKVMAYCVGGNEGVKAYFNHPENYDWICIADGDDGSWWLTGVIAKYWLKGMIVAMQHLQDDG